MWSPGLDLQILITCSQKAQWYDRRGMGQNPLPSNLSPSISACPGPEMTLLLSSLGIFQCCSFESLQIFLKNENIPNEILC